MTQRRTLLTATFGAALSIPALAQAPWPSRPVTMIVPWAPGGSNDVTARLLTPHLSERFGQQFVVENRAGGGGSVGMGLVARARPDGQTLLFSSASNHVFHALLSTELGYDPREAFAAVSMLVDVPNAIAVHPSLGVSTLPELLAKIRATRGGLPFASSGTGSSNHLGGELLRMMTNTELTHVPYRGGGPAVTDLVSGTVPMAVMNLPSLVGPASDGRIRIIAVATEQRVSFRPDIPTVAEQGVPGYAVRSWAGLFAPRGTPQPVIERLAAATREILALPAVKDRLTALASEPIWMSPADTDTFVRAEYEKWRPIIRAAGVTLE